jgi:SAM-dependent methyltransferase
MPTALPMVDPIEAFYTRHPYPPPVDNLDRARDDWRDVNRHRADHHLLWPDKPYRAGLMILVAGCGTWQAAKYALCRPAAQVVGIDVSTTSLAHTQHLKDHYNLTRLDIHRLPLERVGELGRQFDLIVCTGVLHHLDDPEAGLRALRDVLAPDGAISLMVYAPYGRAGIYMLQDYCRRLGIGTSDREIHDLAVTLASLPPAHPLAPLLRGTRDARNSDALADALLNPRDRSYTVPQLFDLIERNGLTFGRWNWQAPYLPQCGAMASTPHAARLAELPAVEQYAAMELWRGTMATHSLIVHRREASAASAGVSFDDERWRRFVPIRLPWTQLIQERLPVGAAGVLVNTGHQHRDLVLTIDNGDKALVGGIDGRRNIEDLAERTRVPLGRAHAFFQQLWWHDQVVFDTSNTG